VATTLFLGGWSAPWGIVHVWPGANEGYWPLLWFFGKMFIFIFMFIWLRGSLPRLRYDQFMAFGWKRLIPISLVWILAVGAVRAVSLEDGLDRTYLLIGAGILAALFVLLFFVGESTQAEDADDEREVAAPEPVDAFAGGFPVPPMPTGGPVRGGAAPLIFGDRTTVSEES
jgi:NADH-quinone oxidoreductase subunit H